MNDGGPGGSRTHRTHGLSVVRMPGSVTGPQSWCGQRDSNPHGPRWTDRISACPLPPVRVCPHSFLSKNTSWRSGRDSNPQVSLRPTFRPPIGCLHQFSHRSVRSPCLAEGERIELPHAFTWPWRSRPAPYHSGNPPALAEQEGLEPSNDIPAAYWFSGPAPYPAGSAPQNSGGRCGN